MDEMAREYQPKYPNYDVSELRDDHEIAHTTTEKYTVDFPQLDQLVDGVPLNVQEGRPYVADTTIPGIVRQIPRDSIKQLPVFAAVVNGSKKSINALLASCFLRKVVFNKKTFGKGVLGAMIMAVEQAIAHGYAPLVVSTGHMRSEFGPMLKVFHYSDVDAEPGIQDADESNEWYTASNITKSRLRRIISKAEKQEDTLWDVPALKKLLATEPEGKRYTLYQSDRQKAKREEHAPAYQFITKQIVGAGGEFITFCPQFEEGVLRVMPNKSKFGYPRVTYLVIDPAPLSAHGTSRVRLAAPLQNLKNIYYQNIGAVLLVNSNPPIFQRGKFITPVVVKQRAVWKTNDPQANAELKNLDNGAFNQFKDFSQELTAQIQNIMGRPAGTANGNTNAFSYSKTGPGVKMQERDQNSSVNQITNIVESAIQQYALVALDTWLSEKTYETETNPQDGMPVVLTEDYIVDDECKDAINRIQPGIIGEDNIMKIDWNEFYDSIKELDVDIELGITKDELSEKHEKIFKMP